MFLCSTTRWPRASSTPCAWRRRASPSSACGIGEEAFEHHAGGLVTMKYGVPIQVGGVAVDLLSARANDREDALGTPRSSGVPVAPLSVLIYLKLKSPRPRDLADVMELIRLGIERDAIRADLVARAPELVERWNRAVAGGVARGRVSSPPHACTRGMRTSRISARVYHRRTAEAEAGSESGALATSRGSLSRCARTIAGSSPEVPRRSLRRRRRAAAPGRNARLERRAGCRQLPRGAGVR